METRRSRIICFSPTGSTKKLAAAVASGLGLPFTVSDLSLPEARKELPEVGSDELVILAAPVYYGRVQSIAAESFSGLKGRGQPALLLVNYGNRHYEDAMGELFDLVAAAGFSPMGAAALVSEHSFSTDEYPMAKGRPDAEDVDAAHAFGERMAEKLRAGAHKLERLPGNTPYKAYPDFHRAPVSTEACTLCGTCVESCPTAAISVENGSLVTSEPACIVCQACVKLCPEGAREDSAPGARETREYLKPLVAERREPEFFE